jgi:DNA polymerase-3 subunit gamma/tau
MSYLVLARKWRPQTFEEVVGQKPVVRTLQNALVRNRVSHAMIFSGVRGVGKTTLARIMAKALNCKNGPARTPCSGCDSCIGIADGSAVDLHEIDGASNRGIQEIRELKENIKFFPTSSRYKIIIIDEVHMLTTEAFNALLKTLEEPPEHVFFMFATTELHKVPITILSRCQRYELSRITSRELAEFFSKIAQAEKVAISERALSQIVREADGSVRDGLSLLDQIFSFADASNAAGELEVTDDEVSEMLGLIDSRMVGSIAAALLEGNLSTCLQLFDEAYGKGIDLKRFTSDLLTFFRSLLICKIVPDPAALIDFADQELADLRNMAAGYEVETLHNLFQLLLKGIEEMQYSKHPRLMLEMAFVKATQAGTIVPVTELLGRVDGLLQGNTGEPSAAAQVFARVESAERAPAFTSRQPKISPEMVKQPEPVPEQVRPTGAAETKSTPPAISHKVPDVRAEKKNVRKSWNDFIDYVMERKKWMAHVLRLSSGVKEENNVLALKFDEKADCKMLQTPEHMKNFVEYVQDFFQQEFKIQIKVRGSDDIDSNGNPEPQEERRALGRDPLVQMATDIFDGRVVNIRTGPRSR